MEGSAIWINRDLNGARRGGRTPALLTQQKSLTWQLCINKIWGYKEMNLLKTLATQSQTNQKEWCEWEE